MKKIKKENTSSVSSLNHLWKKYQKSIVRNFCLFYNLWKNTNVEGHLHIEIASNFEIFKEDPWSWLQEMNLRHVCLNTNFHEIQFCISSFLIFKIRLILGSSQVLFLLFSVQSQHCKLLISMQFSRYSLNRRSKILKYFK